MMDLASPSQPFGYLFTLDLYSCKPGSCDDLHLCYRFLEDLVDVLNMKKQAPPFIFRTDAQAYPDKAGLSGWVPLIESGVQIHTLSRRNFISVDVYSCRKFETASVGALVNRFFAPGECEEHLIERGVKYHREGA